MDILKQQYELVQGSRGVMLSFIENEIGQDITTPIKEFNNSTILYLLVHTAETYKHWGANFAMQQNLPYAYDDAGVVDISSIRQLFNEADKMIADFLKKFGLKL